MSTNEPGDYSMTDKKWEATRTVLNHIPQTDLKDDLKRMCMASILNDLDFQQFSLQRLESVALALEDKPPAEALPCPPARYLKRGDLLQLPVEWDGGTIGFVMGVDEEQLYNMGRIKSYVIVTDTGKVLHLSDEATEALEKPTPEQLEKFVKAIFSQRF